uniref:HORMA domain-containing protein n=1 Tax=Meloidogyne javanica TaxID=6303 RepID=A0A915MXB1_MELJA
MVQKKLSKNSWETAFPASQQLESDQLRFMARMSYIAIAHYLLYRKIVPVGVYKRRRIGDTIIYCFDSSKRWGQKLSQMMQGLKEAIEKKYLESALVVINEGEITTEVFIVRFCYDGHFLDIRTEDGHPIISLQYKDEKTFRSQTKHVIKKINSVTKKLSPLNNGVLPDLKLTYMPGVPVEYQPPYFKAGNGTYNFVANPPLYTYGYISSISTAIAFQLKSTYLDKGKINELEDTLYEDAGITDKQFVDAKDVSGDCFSDEEESPIQQIAESPIQQIAESPIMQVEVPRGEVVYKHVFLEDPKSSKSMRSLLKSPEDMLAYDATEETDGLKRLQKSAYHFGLDLKIFGLGEEWKGGNMYSEGGAQKIRLLRENLLPYKDDNLIVLFTDAYDVLINSNSETILRTFFASFPETKILFGAESYCWPEKSLASKYPPIVFGERYLNSGMFIGYIKEVLKMLEIAKEQNLADNADDQLFYTYLFLDENIRNDLKIGLDSLSIIFQNLNGAQEFVTIRKENNEAMIYNSLYITYPLILHANNQKYNIEMVEEFKRQWEDFYASFSVINSVDVKEYVARTNSFILAPLLLRPGTLFSNFWGAISTYGYYVRSQDYVGIIQGIRKGIWNVPFIGSSFLISSKKFVLLEKSYNWNINVDSDIAFAKFCRDEGHFMYVDASEDPYFYGYLIDTDGFSHLDYLAQVNLELYDFPNNRQLWEKRYIHPEYFEKVRANGTIVKQECPDVYDFPFLSDRFCEELIQVMENYGQWSDGSNRDARLQGGYENVPTRDIHMIQVGLDKQWLKILDDYIAPIQEKVFIGFYKRPVQADMMFVVRYKPDEQPFLRPHHDASTYSIDMALNKRGIDYEGGGVRFLRYNCTVEADKVGWTMLFPGRLTHYHEGGHAGCEAAAAASRKGAKSLLITQSKATVGAMSCNPSFGGIGKGHLMREIDAMDGICARLCDDTGIHFHVLNRSHGPAVIGLRALIDRKLYKKAMQKEIFENTPNLDIIESTVEDLIIEEATCSNKNFTHKLVGELNWGGKSVPGGRMGEGPSSGLAETFARLGFKTGRLSTGTPPRLLSSTINYDKFTKQLTDEEPIPFSFLNSKVGIPKELQLASYVGYTNDNLVKIVRENIDEKHSLISALNEGIK